MRNACAVLACIVWLTACVTTKQTEKPAAPSAPPQAVDLARPVAATEEPAGVAPDTAQATSDGDATPPCVAPGEKPKAKTKPKPKRIVVHQEPPAPPPTPPAATPSADHAIDADLKLLNSSVESVLGRKVQGLHGEDFGRVVDLLADAAGRVRVAVLDYGGFLGVGNRRIAVEWSLLRADPEHPGEPLTLRITREKLQSAPAYKDSARPPTLMVP